MVNIDGAKKRSFSFKRFAREEGPLVLAMGAVTVGVVALLRRQSKYTAQKSRARTVRNGLYTVPTKDRPTQKAEEDTVDKVINVGQDLARQKVADLGEQVAIWCFDRCMRYIERRH